MCTECHCSPCHPSCPNNDAEPEIIAYCHKCDEPIYEGGEDYYEIEDSVYCEGCVMDARRTA